MKQLRAKVLGMGIVQELDCYFTLCLPKYASIYDLHHTQFSGMGLGIACVYTLNVIQPERFLVRFIPEVAHLCNQIAPLGWR